MNPHLTAYDYDFTEVDPKALRLQADINDDRWPNADFKIDNCGA